MGALARNTGVLVLGSAVYGYTVGCAHSALYAERNLIKVPLLILATASVCAVAYIVVARFLGARLRLAQVRDLVIGLFRDLAVLLTSLAVPNLFLACILRTTDDSHLGEYSLFLGLNVLFVGVSGSVALVRQGREVLAASAVTPLRAGSVIGCWLLLTLAVGGQTAFYLRPFFGLPASRGNVPPFAVGAEPDVRGATNFYEAVLQVFTEPALPSSWGAPAKR